LSIDLHKELSTKINPDLVNELISDYVEMQNRFLLKDLDPALTASGRFCEDVLKCLRYLKESIIAPKTGINFNLEFNMIWNYPKTDTLEEILYHQIPLVAQSTYTIRNKRRVSHSRGEDLLYIDMIHIVTACDWMLANLLYASHGVSENDAINSMMNIIEFKSPLVSQIGSWNVLNRMDLEPVEGLLVLLFNKERGVENFTKLARDLKLRYSQSQAYKAIASAHDNALVFRDPETDLVELLPEGRKKTMKLIKG